MGIYGALATAVTGMRAQAFALENISGNIANSQTTGYKRMETGFIDLIPDAAVGRQVPGAVLAYSRSTNDVRGDIITSSTSTHVALNGSGFFVVSEKLGTTDGEAVFGDANYYTRRGDFEMDREGYLVNGAGYYLKGVPIDPTTGNVSGSVPQMVQVSNGIIPARATNRVQYELNLPAVPAVGLVVSPASVASTRAGMTANQVLDGYQFRLTVGAGAPQTFTASSTSTLQDLVNWVNTSVTGATASISGGGELVIAADNAADSLTVAGDDVALAGLGLTAGTVPAPSVPATVTSGTSGMTGTDGLVANLGWVGGETFTVAVGGGATETFTEGVDGTTLDDLRLWIDGLPGVSASLSLAGELVIVADSTADSLTIGGDAASLAGLGFAAATTPAPAPATSISGTSGMNGSTGLVSDLDWGIGNFSIAVGGGAPQVFPATGTPTLQNLIDWVNTSVPGASARVTSEGRLEISANHIESSITFAGDPDTLTALGISAGTVTASGTAPEDNLDFLDRTVEGGAITVYAANGASVNVQMRWGKVSEDPDSWRLYYMNNSNPQDWQQVPAGEFEFAANGTLLRQGGVPVQPNEALRIEIPNLTINGTVVGTVELDFGRGGLTQFDNSNGRASVTTLEQDGYPAGAFMSVAINDAGRVVATYSNGEQIEIFQLVTANFNAENMLKRLDGGLYASTAQSGEAILSLDGGISGGALESSNTDISEEFTKLIVTQQAYAAGTRIVSTSDEMLQEALNMVR